MVGWASSMNTPGYGHTTLQPLCVVSEQPAQVISPGLSSKPQVSAPSPHLCHWMCVSGWDMQGGGPDHPCGSRSVLPATDQLLHFPLSLWSFLSILPYHPTGWGSFPEREKFTFVQLPLRGTSPVLLPPFFSFTWPGYVEIFIILPGIWGLLLVFSRCPLRIVPSVDVFLMWLWEEVSSTFNSTIFIRTLSFILDFAK